MDTLFSALLYILVAFGTSLLYFSLDLGSSVAVALHDPLACAPGVEGSLLLLKDKAYPFEAIPRFVNFQYAFVLTLVYLLRPYEENV